MNKYTDLEALERLCILVEEAGVDIAPNFDQYTDMAFAIANALGEAGRDCFHRLCALCPKYQSVKADKLFTDAIAKGRGANGLGTVFYLAEQAGINLGDLKGLFRIPGGGAYDFRAPARTVYIEQGQNPPYNNRNRGIFVNNSKNNNRFSESFPENGAGFRKTFRGAKGGQQDVVEEEETLKELPYEDEYTNIPDPFPTYQWPKFLQRIMDCGEDIAQRDMLFCCTVGALGATVNRLVKIPYSKKTMYPSMQVFIIAPAASGKGAISWVRYLVLPFHKEKLARYESLLAAYQVELRTWSNEGRKRDESAKPIPPKMELFFIAGDNTGTGIQENIIDNDGHGLILEAEAEVLSAAIDSEYGRWSHILRKAFDHEFLSYNRRKDHEYRECDCLRLSVIICGTPGQLGKFIPGAENGLFSRQLFYFMPSQKEFLNMFHSDNKTDHTTLFMQWGFRWKAVVDALQVTVSEIRLELTTEQEDRMVDCMSQLFRHAGIAHGGSMRSSVVRLAINLLRIAGVVALIRALDPLLMMEDKEQFSSKMQHFTRTLLECEGLEPSPDTHPENAADGIVSQLVLHITQEDYDAVIALAEPFYRHAEHALMSLPDENIEARKVTPQELFLADLPMTFTRQEYISIGEKHRLSVKQCEYYVEKLLNRTILERRKRGEYSFVKGKSRKASDAKAKTSENGEESLSGDTL
jgi:hypothetical protein